MIRRGVTLALCCATSICAITIGQEEEQERLFQAVIHHDMATIAEYVHMNPQNPNPAIDMYRYHTPVYGWVEVPNNTILHVAAEVGAHNIIGLLVDYGINVNIRNAQNKTALHKATTNGQLHIVRTLLHAGADTNARDNNGDTALTAGFRQAKELASSAYQNVDPQEIWKATALLVSQPIEHIRSNAYTRKARKSIRNLVGTTINYLKDMYRRI